MQITETFKVRRSPQDVFDFMVDPANLARWQTVKTYVTPLDEGPPREGFRVREGTKVGPREWDQVVEFTEFVPGRAFAVKVVEGPPSDGRWTFDEDAGSTRVGFSANFDGPKLLGPLMKRMAARQFRSHHARLRALLEGEVARGDAQSPQ